MAISTNGSSQQARTVAAPCANPPGARRIPAPLSHLVGREREIDQIRALIMLNGPRLITITGPGGVGKSRLAIEVARGLVERDGWDAGIIELRDVADRTGLFPAIVSTLNRSGGGGAWSPDLFQIAPIVPAHQLLLVLDNLDHVGPVAPEIAHLLGASSNLVVLATSRELLGCAGERRVELAPLPNPVEHRFTSPVEMAGNPSVRLFLDRARNVSPDLPATFSTLATIAEICGRVDGIPLAIELAAAWAVALSPAEILQDLESLLLGAIERTGDRSSSMSATIAWSYKRLDPDERRCFRLLSVFAGSLDRDSVVNIAERAGLSPDPAAISAWIRALVEKSLLVRSFDEHGKVRLGMYEMIREFARGRLRTSGEAPSVREAHAQWTISCAERVEETPGEPCPTTANIRLALEWLNESGDGERYAHLCLLAVDHWYHTGYQHEGHEHLLRATAWAITGSGARARLYEELGRFARALGDITGAADALGIACHEYRRLGNPGGEASCLRALGSIRVIERRHDDAVRLCEAALAIHRAADDRMGMAHCLHSIAWVAIERDQLEEAERLFQTSLGLLADIDDPRTAGRFLLSLGTLSVRQKRYPEAAEHFQSCADLWRECGYQTGIAEVMADLGAVAVITGDREVAASYLLTSVTMYRTLGVLLRSPELIEAAAGLALVCGNLDQARQWLGAATTFRAAIGSHVWSTWAGHLEQWRATARPNEAPVMGRAPSMAEAIDEIWGWLSTLPSVAPDGDSVPRLTRRELEVLGLITAGLSDQAIADRIFISRRTVSRHVSSILAKLKLESRTAAAVLAVREGLVPT